LRTEIDAKKKAGRNSVSKSDGGAAGCSKSALRDKGGKVIDLDDLRGRAIADAIAGTNCSLNSAPRVDIHAPHATQSSWHTPSSSLSMLPFSNDDAFIPFQPNAVVSDRAALGRRGNFLFAAVIPLSLF